MVSKQRQKRQKKKQWDTKNDKKKIEISTAGMWRISTLLLNEQKTECSRIRLRKQNIRRVKARLLNDIEYRKLNSLRATMNEQRKRIRPESRKHELAKKENQDEKTVE